MTDRVNTLTVVLEGTMRVDDLEHLKTVIGSIRGVLDVQAGEIVDASVFGARTQERIRLRNAVWAVFQEEGR